MGIHLEKLLQHFCLNTFVWICIIMTSINTCHSFITNEKLRFVKSVSGGVRQARAQCASLRAKRVVGMRGFAPSACLAHKLMRQARAQCASLRAKRVVGMRGFAPSACLVHKLMRGPLRCQAGTYQAQHLFVS